MGAQQATTTPTPATASTMSRILLSYLNLRRRDDAGALQTVSAGTILRSNGPQQSLSVALGTLTPQVAAR